MMVGDDDVHTELFRLFYFLGGGDPGVDGDDQIASLGGKPFDGPHGNAVTVRVSFGYIVSHVPAF